MKRTSLLKTMLLLCALIVGSSSAWAEETITYVFTSKAWTATVGGEAVNWTSGKDGAGYSNNGVQVTTNESYNGANATSPVSFNKISKIVVTYNTNKSAGEGSIEVKVGDNDAKSNAVAYGGSGDGRTANYTTQFDYATTQTGKVKLTVNTTTNSLYICSIAITYTPDDSPSSDVKFSDKTPSINFPATKTYSQAPTTADGYTGTITYSITEDNAGATIDAESGLVTVTKAGTVTVKAEAAAISGFVASSDTYKLTVNDTRTSPGLAWSAASADVTYGADDNIFPTLTNPYGVTVTYSSSKTSAATIDKNTGVITLKDYEGSTEISAKFAGDETYQEQTVTYTLNVSKAPFTVKDGVFDFVSAATASVDYGSGVTTTSSSSEYVTEEKTWTAGDVTMMTSGKYRWWEKDGTLRFYNNDPQSKLVLTVPSGKLITKVVFTGGSTFNPSSGTLSSGTWTGGGVNSVTFEYNASSSINVKTITVTYSDENFTITPTKPYTTLTCAYPLDFTGKSITAYIVKDNDASDGVITLTQVNKVPAGTGLVLKAEKTGDAVNIPILTEAADDVTGNLMKGSATETTNIVANKGYILKDGAFHPATDGTLPAGKAYLKLDVSSSASELKLDFNGETTKITTTNFTNDTNNNGVFYNLNGQRVTQPTKGLYIVNGKKYIVK